MVLAVELSVRLGHCPPPEVGRVRRHLAAAGLPISLADLAEPDWTADAILERMLQDKKVEAGRPAFVLVRGIGEAFVSHDVAPEAVRALLAEELSARSDARQLGHARA